MRRLLASLGAAAAVSVGLVVGSDLSGAGVETAMMQAVPPESVEPATVTVSNVSDPASRCETPNGAVPVANGATVQVSLNLTSTNGTMQTNTVTPDGMGDWSQMYTDLTAGTYTVTGQCEVVHSGNNGGAPQQVGPFSYVPVQFVVTAPEADPGAAAPAGVVAARPSFTG